MTKKAIEVSDLGRSKYSTSVEGDTIVVTRSFDGKTIVVECSDRKEAVRKAKAAPHHCWG